MSTPGAPPRISSMRSTWSAGMRWSRPDRLSSLEAGREPSNSTLPTAPEKPRTELFWLIEKPGMRVTMSSALAGRASAKKAGG